MSRLLAYVGSRTTRERNARGEGISVYSVEPHGRGLELVQVVDGLVNPSYLALNRAGDRLYSVHGDQQEVSAFIVDVDGQLTLLNRLCCEGRNPVHLALSPEQGHLIVSNHLSGNLAVIELTDEGALGAVVQIERLPGDPGPHRIEQPFSKPHFNPFDPSGRFVVVPDKGLDRLFSFRFETGRLVPASQPWVDAREGAGPRHAAFHPRLPILYAVNELDSTLTTYSFHRESGALSPVQVLSTLPDTFTGNSRAAGIVLSLEGRFVYASNRGADSIACFAVDAATGVLRLMGSHACGGRTPRFFTVAPGGTHLFVLNEDSDEIVRFAADAQTGALSPDGEPVRCGSPVCMVFRA